MLVIEPTCIRTKVTKLPYVPLRTRLVQAIPVSVDVDQ